MSYSMRRVWGTRRMVALGILTAALFVVVVHAALQVVLLGRETLEGLVRLPRNEDVDALGGRRSFDTARLGELSARVSRDADARHWRVKGIRLVTGDINFDGATQLKANADEDSTKRDVSWRDGRTRVTSSSGEGVVHVTPVLPMIVMRGAALLGNERTYADGTYPLPRATPVAMGVHTAGLSLTRGTVATLSAPVHVEPTPFESIETSLEPPQGVCDAGFVPVPQHSESTDEGHSSGMTDDVSRHSRGKQSTKAASQRERDRSVGQKPVITAGKWVCVPCPQDHFSLPSLPICTPLLGCDEMARKIRTVHVMRDIGSIKTTHVAVLRMGDGREHPVMYATSKSTDDGRTTAPVMLTSIKRLRELCPNQRTTQIVGYCVETAQGKPVSVSIAAELSIYGSVQDFLDYPMAYPISDNGTIRTPGPQPTTSTTTTTTTSTAGCHISHTPLTGFDGGACMFVRSHPATVAHLRRSIALEYVRSLAFLHRVSTGPY
eukprot:Opistho-2@52081